MVIDGLPAKFVLGKDDEPPPKSFKEAMPYTQSLLTKGRTVGYHAKAAPPTVTMPHLKAMVSGAVRGFLDVAFNFNTDDGSERTRGYNSLEETFCCLYMKAADLHRSWKSGEEKRSTCEDNCHSTLVAYHNFLRTASEWLSHIATDVKDTVQVDQNVSRHLVDERSRADWTLESSDSSLSWLGHVGHLGGRNSMPMTPKLGEMDEVIKTIDLNSLPTNNNDQGRTLLAQKNHMDKVIGKTTIKRNIELTNNKLLELNSRELLRLLEVQLPGLVCENFLYDNLRDDGSERTRGRSSLEETICCLYMKAADLGNLLVRTIVTVLLWQHIIISASGKYLYKVVPAGFSDHPNQSIVAAARKLNVCTISLPASIWYSSGSNQHRRQWVEVAALYYMGMAGHFGLGNTNTLATIDVAGVFIGVFNHSTLLSMKWRKEIAAYRAADLHRSWKSGEEKRSVCEDNCYNTLVAAYYNFLRIAKACWTTYNWSSCYSRFMFDADEPCVSSRKASSYDATLMAQIVYVVLGFCSTTTVVLVPWCLLSKIQPVNSMPVLFLFLLAFGILLVPTSIAGNRLRLLHFTTWEWQAILVLLTPTP
ncbi:hypothetical protein KY289_009607 [Solanum tuberosum]|nr:hypothetical protein KY289_009607 [Solanum tuberosum]